MKPDLKWEELEWVEPLGDTSSAQEEVLETNIPEYCADISRIVDTVGQICLREKRMADGALTVGGMAKIQVLYLSEESEGLRALSLQVPFSVRLEEPWLASCRTVCLSSRLLLCDVKAVSARKVYARVMPELTATGYGMRRGQICTQANESLRVRREDWDAELLTDISERTFAYSQEILLDSGEITPEELLSERLVPRVIECRHIGSKLVIKGEVSLSVLYRGDRRELSAHEEILPFSQILDGVTQSESATFSVETQLQESELRVIRGDGGCGFGINATIQVTILTQEKKHISYVADLYSIPERVEPEKAVLHPLVRYQRQLLRKDLTQKLEFGANVPFFYLLQAECSQVSVWNDGAQTSLQTTMRMKVLYLDEGGSPVSIERSEEVTTSAENVPDRCRAACNTAEKHTEGSCAVLHIPVEFAACRSENKELSTIVDVKTVEGSESEKRPSVVVRRMMPGETLWDIAKQYRTDEDLIRGLNDMGEAQERKMLLIPKMR